MITELSLSDDAVRLLRRHLTYGGMLIADSADADPGGPFDASMRREIGRIYFDELLAYYHHDIPGDPIIFDPKDFAHEVGATYRIEIPELFAQGGYHRTHDYMLDVVMKINIRAVI